MALEVEGRAGLLSVSDGAVADLRLGRNADLIASQLRGRWSQATRDGQMFSLGLLATTTGVTAGNINGAAAAAGTQFALWNPANSGVYVEIAKVIVGVVSGTPPGGPLFHNLMLNGVPTINSVGVAQNCLAGGSAPKARYISSAAGTSATGGGALTMMRAMALDFSAAAFANTTGVLALEMVEGDIILPPGTGWVPCYASAGTTLLTGYGVTWAETPYP